MLRIIRNQIKMITNKKVYNIKWGRFEPCKNENQETIKTILNGSDHCGDNICGNPYIVKDLIKDNLNCKKDNNNK